MKYEKVLRQAEQTSRPQEECEDIADYMIRYDLTMRAEEKMLIKEGVLL